MAPQHAFHYQTCQGTDYDDCYDDRGLGACRAGGRLRVTTFDTMPDDGHGELIDSVYDREPGTDFIMSVRQEPDHRSTTRVPDTAGSAPHPSTWFSQNTVIQPDILVARKRRSDRARPSAPLLAIGSSPDEGHRPLLLGNPNVSPGLVSTLLDRRPGQPSITAWRLSDGELSSAPGQSATRSSP